MEGLKEIEKADNIISKLKPVPIAYYLVSMFSPEKALEWAEKRMDCFIKTGKMVQRKLDEAGITNIEQRQELSMKFGISWIDHASVEDNEDLQELWANLLANALSSTQDQDDVTHLRHITIIKELRHLDLKILKILHDEYFIFHGYGTLIDERQTLLNEYHKRYGRSWRVLKHFILSLDNLKRLGLIKPIEKIDDLNYINTLIRLTYHGKEFVSACIKAPKPL
jgi:hypothetical protein